MDALEDLLHFVPRLCNSVAHLLDHSAKETEEPYIWLEECPAKILLDKKKTYITTKLKGCNVGIVIKKDFHS